MFYIILIAINNKFQPFTINIQKVINTKIYRTDKSDNLRKWCFKVIVSDNVV